MAAIQRSRIDERELVEAARRGRRPARLAAWFATLAGLLNLISAALPTQAARFRHLDEFVPGIVTSGARVVTASSGVALIALAGGLRRRSHAAWLGAVLVLGIGIVSHLLKDLDIEVALLQTFLAGFLVGKGEHFHARFKLDRRRRLIRPAAAVIAITFMFGVLAVQMLSHSHSLLTSITETARMALTTQTSLEIGRYENAIPYSIASVFYCGVLVMLYLLLAPHEPPSRSPATAELARSSTDSLAWFATRDDRSTIGNSRSVVAYRAEGAVALAAGDPLGQPEDWQAPILAFLGEAARQGRIAAVIGCSETGAEAYRKVGMRRVYLGDEAVIDTKRFTLDGKAMKTVRQSCTRAQKTGYSCRVLESREIESSMRTRMRAISDAWRGAESERGFSMALGRLFDDRDGDALFIVGFDGDGVVQGFLHLVPWGRDGVSLDVMRRDRESLSVLNDFLVASAAKELRERGIHKISLNFSVLRGVLVAGAEPGASRRLKLQRRALLALSGQFQIESLYRFNKKFDPQWESRYLMLETPEDGPRVMTAASTAEGFITIPALLSRFRRQRE